MKRSLTLVAVIVAVISLYAVGAELVSAQSGYDLYQKALVKERAVGDVEEAIHLYQRIIKEHGNNRSLAAKAQLRMGLLYERLGRKSEAQQAFQAVLSRFADQVEIVRQAQAKLSAAGSKAAGGASGSTTAMVTRQVWAGSDASGLGAPTPDGQHFSTVDWATGDLALYDLESGKKRRLTNKGSWATSTELAYISIPSPDGKRIAYSWFNKDQFFDLRLSGIDGADPRVLYRNEEVQYINLSAWSTDGKTILATFQRKDQTSQIVLVSAADGSVRVLKTLDWRVPGKMGISPDGRYIVYDFPPAEGSLKRDVYLLATDASREIPLVVHPAHDAVLGWVPDGTKVLFTSDRTGTSGIWAVSVVNGKPHGNPELVKPDIGRIWPIGFTRNGSFYYFIDSGLLDVYIAQIDAATGEPLSSPVPVTQQFVGVNSAPDWSPDGKHLLYHSERGPGGMGTKLITMHSLETSQEREILPQLSNFHRPRWFTDGHSILVEGTQKGRTGLYRIDPATGAAAPFVQSEPGGSFHHAAWSTDGKSLFYISNLKGQTIQRYDLESGEAKPIYRENRPVEISSLAVSPDGRWLAFRAGRTAQSSASLMIMACSGGEARELFVVKEPETIQNFNGLAWTQDGRRILIAKGNPKQPLELWAIPTQGGEPQKLGLTGEGLRYLRIHPDGRRLVFAAGSNKPEIWVMENFQPATQTRKASSAKR